MYVYGRCTVYPVLESLTMTKKGFSCVKSVEVGTLPVWFYEGCCCIAYGKEENEWSLSIRQLSGFNAFSFPRKSEIRTSLHLFVI